MINVLLRHTFLVAVMIATVLPTTGKSFGGNEDPEEILESVRKKYESMKDLTCRFSQVVQFGVTKNEQEFSGTLQIKKGNRYRVELEDRTVVTDGVTVWTYSAAAAQVVIDRYRDDPRTFTPEKVLTHVPEKYMVTQLPTETRNNREVFVLKLVPKDKMSNLKWMKVWIESSTYLMEKVQLLDVSENLTTYTISDMKLNTSIPDSRFQFHPPAGVEVVDLR